MSFFNKLFGCSKKAEDIQMTLNLVNNGFVINDHSFSFPVRASELLKLLGNARVVEKQCDNNLKKIYCEKYGFDIDTFQPWYYYWDELGLLASSFDHETVHMFAISLHPSKYPLPMPKKCFTGTLLVHGNHWHNEVIKNRGGSLQFDKCYASVHSYGNIKKEKSIAHLEFKLKADDKLEFFVQTEEVRKILEHCKSNSTNIPVAEPLLKKSNIYIMEKYWNNYIGDTDDSLALIEYLADKRKRKIQLKDVFSELGFDNDDFDFRSPDAPLAVTIRDGLEIDFKYAIQVLCDLAAILLECRQNGSVDLQELSDGALDKDYVLISLISTTEEERILLKVLDDFSKLPLEYNLSEVCSVDEMEEMAVVCLQLKNEISNKSNIV